MLCFVHVEHSVCFTYIFSGIFTEMGGTCRIQILGKPEGTEVQHGKPWMNLVHSVERKRNLFGKGN